MKTHEVGNVVELKSGGPAMTVNLVIEAEGNNTIVDINYINLGFKKGDVVCSWFTNNKLEEAPFKAATVEACEE